MPAFCIRVQDLFAIFRPQGASGGCRLWTPNSNARARVQGRDLTPKGVGLYLALLASYEEKREANARRNGEV